jgi:hypothetical protein
MTISEIKRLTAENSPFFFSRKSMAFFGQTLKSFSVRKEIDGRYKLQAPMIDRQTGRKMGQTVRFFNPVTNTLDHK